MKTLLKSSLTRLLALGILCLATVAPRTAEGAWTSPAAPAAHKANKSITNASPAPVGVDQDLARLAVWRSRGPVFEPEQIEACERLLGDIDRAWIHGSANSEAIQLALLDFLGRCLRIADDVTMRSYEWQALEPIGTKGESNLRRLATAILVRRLPESRRHLTLEILLGRTADSNHPLERRVAACEVLQKDRSPDTVLALLSCTRATPPETEVPEDLLNAAIRALSGRDQSAIHLRLIDLLARAEAGQAKLWKLGIERHFRSVQIDSKDESALRHLRAHVAQALASEDWRRASRGVAVSRSLPHAEALPVLIEGLETWVERGEEAGLPVRRVQGEIQAELERRSGRSLGPRADRWQSLWEAYQRGEVQLSGEGPRQAQTVGGFFGLRPETDRVTFVLDRSGSMAAAFGPEGGHDRLTEAAEQMAAFLTQLGETARFDVVVFSDGARSWRKRLEPATAENVRTAKIWIQSGGAKGGTHLRDGIETAMQVDKRGEIDLKALLTDTIIVLCDGETAEGPNWVEPFLRSKNDDARVIFYAVQVGGAGDGTLEQLCEESGGEFLRVQG